MVVTTAGTATTIATRRLRLRPKPLAESHRLLLGEPMNTACAVDYPGDGSLLAAGVVVTAAREERNLGPFGWYQIEVAADGMVVGDCGFLDRPDADGRVTVAYDVVASARNSGYAAEALRALTDWAHGRPDVRAVLADSSRGDRARRRVLEEAGFRLLSECDEVAYYGSPTVP